MTIQTKIRSLCLLILALFEISFSACITQQSTEEVQISATKTITPKSNQESLLTLTTTTKPVLLTKTATPQPTQTEFPPTLTNTPSATIPLQSVVDVSVKYVNGLDELPVLNGKLAFSKIGLSSPAYLADLSTSEQILLGDPDWDYSLIIAISPDREKIVLMDDDGKNYLVDANGNISQQLNHVSSSSGIYDWLDNERLIVHDTWNESNYNSPSITILVNVFSNEITSLEPVYPDLGAVEFNWGISGLTIYHPQIPLVVYPAIKNNQTSIIIFDIEKQQALAEFPAIIGATHTPQWSPDGKYLLLAGNFGDDKPGKDQEIYIVDTEGKIVFKTLFANHIPREEFENFSWSPNTQKIAFWIRVFGSKEEQLAVLDVNSGTITQYNLFSKSGWSGPPIWSPDSQFITVEQITDIDANKITILHLDSGIAYEYLETDIDLVLEGWVK